MTTMKHFQLLILVFLTGTCVINAQEPAMQWHRGHGTAYGNHVHEGMQTSDGGYIGIGQTWESEGSDYSEMIVIKTDASGNKDWQKVIGTS
ncbi:MAG: hypothetical protein KAT15_11205, partial [Bacteroidales bacterium]|nr:hypothetical protein [Bacteroidales bacterium]